MLRANSIYLVFAVIVSAAAVLSQDLPVIYNAKTSAGGIASTACRATHDLRENTTQDIRLLINSSILPSLTGTEYIGPGYGACGCGGFGWRRAAYLNMSDPTQTCPSAWEFVTTPRRSCTRPSSAGSGTCYSAMFPTQDVQYSQVCGRIVGYQFGQPEGFVAGNIGDHQTINGPYVDGVSLTYGSPRQHIWSFVAALDERTGLRAANNGNYRAQCECTDATDLGMLDVPSYVGNDYFCETGVPTGQTFDSSTFYADDPLWDGQGCGPTSTCCTFNNPPWFCKQLPQSTNADLEVRLCSYNSANVENTPIELIEIYTK